MIDSGLPAQELNITNVFCLVTNEILAVGPFFGQKKRRAYLRPGVFERFRACRPGRSRNDLRGERDGGMTKSLNSINP